MALLSGIEIRTLCREGVVVIESRDPARPFSIDAQVTEDAIDLRIADTGIVLAQETKALDILDPPRDAFEEVAISESGYVLKHGEVLYTNTLEIIKLPPYLAGRVGARSTFSRLGLSVHCSHPKLAVGHDQSIPLQLSNNNRVDLVIYPFSAILQLQLEEVRGVVVPYAGKYRGERELSPPVITPRDRHVSIPGPRTRELIELGDRPELILMRQEVEEFRRELEEAAQEARARKGPNVPLTESDIRFVRIPKRRVRIVQFMLGGLGFLFAGWGGTRVLGGPADHWQLVSAGLSLLFGIGFIAVAAFLQFYE